MWPGLPATAGEPAVAAAASSSPVFTGAGLPTRTGLPSSGAGASALSEEPPPWVNELYGDGARASSADSSLESLESSSRCEPSAFCRDAAAATTVASALPPLSSPLLLLPRGLPASSSPLVSAQPAWTSPRAAVHALILPKPTAPAGAPAPNVRWLALVVSSCESSAARRSRATCCILAPILGACCVSCSRFSRESDHSSTYVIARQLHVDGSRVRSPTSPKKPPERVTR